MIANYQLGWWRKTVCRSVCRRDVFTVHLAERPLDAGSARNSEAARWECPAAQLPCEAAPFAALAPCGHILSERAIKQASVVCCLRFPSSA